jgi:hypothetical protein
LSVACHFDNVHVQTHSWAHRQACDHPANQCDIQNPDLSQGNNNPAYTPENQHCTLKQINPHLNSYYLPIFPLFIPCTKLMSVENTVHYCLSTSFTSETNEWVSVKSGTEVLFISVP